MNALTNAQVALLYRAYQQWPADVRDWEGGRADHLELARRGYVRRLRSHYKRPETASVVTEAGFDHLRHLGVLAPTARW